VRTYPDKSDAVKRTLSYFEPAYLASSVLATVLIAGDSNDWYGSLEHALGGSVERYETTHEGQTDRDAIEGWIADRLGAERLPRIWTPEAIGSWSS
jgi:hypothetical protein